MTNSPEIVAAVAISVNKERQRFLWGKQLKADRAPVYIDNCLADVAITAARPFIEAEMRERVKRLKEALHNIATSSYCTYSPNGGSYDIGVTDGHRYCANIAKAALATSTPEGE